MSAADALASIWSQLPGSQPDVGVNIVGDTGLISAFEVDQAMRASVAAAASAGAALAGASGTSIEIDAPTVAANLATVVELDGEPIPKWASLSGYYRTADDRRVQLHANFDHHAAGIVKRLGCASERSAVEQAILEWSSDDLEAALIDDGMICAKLRTLEEWQSHPHAAATNHLPVLSVDQIGDAPPRPRAAEDVRVLDCSRVLAGPVAGQTLAAFGADVLRVSAPDLASVPICVMATGFGKRNTFADLRTDGGRDTFAALMAGADVWVDAFRPGALGGHGFSGERAASLAPGVIVVQLCAFDWVGPWAGRRGFDSIVQTTTGIVDAGAKAAGRDPVDEPTPLPVQALDYGTGFLAAAAAAHMVRHQSEVGGSWLVRLSLLRMRNWLVGLGGPTPFEPAAVPVDRSRLQTVDSAFGSLTAPNPIVGSWSSPPAELGTAPPTWR